ncbi:glycosyltransferase family 2 protein [uncultured Roseobacter sp.]|uniref:glycosyltransferase n=1 Tax=uncultured Roseobacter sp. TaxID=114847 RepID=UPI00260D0D9B|nr:glycosyltransferase family 2 protein [uncultured Roseobacter sp.]
MTTVTEDMTDRLAPPSTDLCDVHYTVGISIIVPTYREAENIPHLLNRVDQVRERAGLTLEVIFVDDNSRDGSVEAVEAAGFDWARILVRETDRGLSSAVVDGFRAARYPVLICMDCDLSHPPETIPNLVLALHSGQQFVIGSRYVPGGSTDDDWGFFRWFNSFVATVLARPLTAIRDPMSGFFALRKSDFDKARDLNPVGYKIALELIVKCGFENVGEVPIHFTDRQFGESKLTLAEQLRYIQHLRRLYMFQFAGMMYLAQFLVVGASGVVVNLSVLSLAFWAGLPEWLCLASGICVSLVTNFLLNRRFTFSYARHEPMLRQFLGFVSASVLGLVVNYCVALGLRMSVLSDGVYALQLAALVGIAAGMGFNFLGARYLVFRKRFLRK